MDRFKLTIGKFETIVDDQTEVTAIGDKLSVTFNDYTTGKMTRFITDEPITITSLDDKVEKQFVMKEQYYEKTFDKRLYFEDSLVRHVSEFKKMLTEKGEYEIVRVDNEGLIVTIHYKDAYPKVYPLKKERDN